jgi:hypothetical protein
VAMYRQSLFPGDKRGSVRLIIESSRHQMILCAQQRNAADNYMKPIRSTKRFNSIRLKCCFTTQLILNPPAVASLKNVLESPYRWSPATVLTLIIPKSVTNRKSFAYPRHFLHFQLQPLTVSIPKPPRTKQSTACSFD